MNYYKPDKIILLNQNDINWWSELVYPSNYNLSPFLIIDNEHLLSVKFFPNVMSKILNKTYPDI